MEHPPCPLDAAADRFAAWLNGEAKQGGDTRADEIVARPVESLNVEVKTWLDLQDDAHAAKLVKALFALRNRNGGYLVIGFDDATLQPDPYLLGRPLEEVYHHDEVQAKVSRYAHETFEIMVRYGRRDGNPYPVSLCRKDSARPSL